MLDILFLKVMCVLCCGKKALDSMQVLNLEFHICFSGNTTLGLMYRGGVWFVLFLNIVANPHCGMKGDV